MNTLLAQLNRRLKRRGEFIWMERRVGTGANGVMTVRAKVPAIVRALTVEQLVGNITTQNYFVIISPTHLYDEKQWPGGIVVNAQTFGIIPPSDQRLPTSNDNAYVRGRSRAISVIKPVFDRDACIRIEMMVAG